jgi:hypothetical protein
VVILAAGKVGGLIAKRDYPFDFISSYNFSFFNSFNYKKYLKAY